MAIYCTEIDLYKVFSDLDNYDLKIDLLENDFVNTSGIIWILNDSGRGFALYRDGADLGAAQANAGAVTDDGQWHYDTDADKLTLATTDDPSTLRLEFAPQSWVTAKAGAMADASDELESLLDVSFPRPLPKAQNSNSGREYDFILTKVSSILAVIGLISASDPKSPLIATFNTMLYNEEGTGIIDRINKGEIRFSFEITSSDKMGEIEDVTTDASTTGYVTDVQGTTTVAYGVMLVKIGTGGTITQGTENTTVTYGVTDQDGDTLITDTTITTIFQNMGNGISARFIPGIYTAGDSWRIVVQGTPVKNSTIKSYTSVRR